MKVRSSVEILKVIYWYESINWLGNFQSTYQMEKHFEPLNDLVGHTIFRNKWNRYKYGKHTPTSRTIDLVDQQTLIPKKIINHYLWTILEKQECSCEALENEILKLNPYISQIVYGFSPFGERRLKPLHRIDVNKLISMISKNPLDCLAIFYIYWRMNQSSQKTCHRLAQECAKYIYQALLIMGGTNYYCASDRVIQLFYEWFEKNIFTKTYWTDNFYYMNSEVFIKNIYLLQVLTTQNVNTQQLKRMDYPSVALKILSKGMQNKEYEHVCRVLRWGKKNSNKLHSDMVQKVYLPPDCHLGLGFLLMDKDGNYSNQVYAHWLTLNLSIFGKLANYLRERKDSTD